MRKVCVAMMSKAAASTTAALVGSWRKREHELIMMMAVGHVVSSTGITHRWVTGSVACWRGVRAAGRNAECSVRSILRCLDHRR